MGTWKLKNKTHLKLTSAENFDTGTWNQIGANTSEACLVLRKWQRYYVGAWSCFLFSVWQLDFQLPLL